MSQFRKSAALFCIAVFAVAAIASFAVAMPAVLVELSVAILAFVACAVPAGFEPHRLRPALIALRASHHLPRASILPAVR